MATVLIEAAAPEVQPFLTAFNALPERDALRLLDKLADRFSYSTGADDIYHAIRLIAHDAAEEEGWRGDDLAERYLAADRFAYRDAFVPTVTLTVIEGGRC
jgi:hypothetical protein